ncbi:MAG: hypothetical protein WA395_02200 [Nitrososphaeraceae archaeon]
MIPYLIFVARVFTPPILIEAVAYLVTKGQLAPTLGIILLKEFESLLDEIYDL